ncbi:MAG: hypothetical protein C4K49_04295 [Candidatus Thorarchaeota archaeon]|nr:MAG: hypothetical protein C4K49_04295 [Candidatus Thorarchaeota archaeon]
MNSMEVCMANLAFSSQGYDCPHRFHLGVCCFQASFREHRGQNTTSREWKYSVWIGGGILGSLSTFEKRKLKEVRSALTHG